MDRLQIEKKLKEIMTHRVKDLKPELLKPEVELSTLGVDSLAFSWIIADMEESFGFIVKGSDAMKLKTLSASIDYVEKQLGKV